MGYLFSCAAKKLLRIAYRRRGIVGRDEKSASGRGDPVRIVESSTPRWCDGHRLVFGLRHAAAGRRQTRPRSEVDWLHFVVVVTVGQVVYNHRPLAVATLTRHVVTLGFPDQRLLSSPENQQERSLS